MKLKTTNICKILEGKKKRNKWGKPGRRRKSLEKNVQTYLYQSLSCVPFGFYDIGTCKSNSSSPCLPPFPFSVSLGVQLHLNWQIFQIWDAFRPLWYTPLFLSIFPSFSPPKASVRDRERWVGGEETSKFSEFCLGEDLLETQMTGFTQGQRSEIKFKLAFHGGECEAGGKITQSGLGV